MIRKLLLGLGAFFVLFFALTGVFLCTGPGLKLAATIIVQVSGGAITIDGTDGRLLGRWRLSGVKVETGAGSVALETVECDWEPSRLLKRELSLLDIAAEGLEVVLQESDGDSTEKDQEHITLPEITVPFGIIVGRLELKRAVIRQKGADTALFALDSLLLAASVRGDRLLLEKLHLEAPEYGTALRGDLRFTDNWPFSAAGEYRFHQQGFAEVRGTLSLSGSLEALEAVIEILEPAQLTVHGKGTDLLNNFSWQLAASAQEFSPSAINSEWPELALGLQLASEGTLEHYRVDLTSHIEGSDFQPVEVNLALKGSTDHVLIETARIAAAEATVAIVGEAEWKEVFRWRAALDVDRLDPSVYAGMVAAEISGRITADGEITPQRTGYRVKVEDLAGTLAEPELELRGDLQLEGTEKGLRLGTSRFKTGGATLYIAGDVSWEQVLSWSAEVRAESLDPSAFGELPGGKINSRIHSRGSLEDDELAFVAEVKDFSGQLAGYAVGGGGVVEYRNSELVVDSFHLTDGRNEFRLHGTVKDELDLSFSFAGQQLEALLPALKGAISAQGHVGGTRDQPHLAAQLEGKGLSYDGYSVASVDADIDFALEDQGRVDAAVEIRGADVGGYLVDRVEFNIDGSTTSHSGAILIDSDFGNLRVNLSGALDDQEQWRGNVSEVGYDHADYGQWRQKGSAAVEASAESLKFSDFCLYSGDNGLCSSAEGDISGTWSTRVEGLRFSLSKLNEWGILSPILNGVVQGEFTAAGTGVVLSTLDGNLEVPELELDADVDEVYPELKWFTTRVETDLAEETLRLSISSRFVDGSAIKGGIRIEQFGDLSGVMTDLPVSGSLDLLVRDLSPLAIITGSYLVPSGQLSSSLRLSGKIGAPVVDGTLRLENGKLTLPELGVTLEQVEGDVSSTANELTVGLQGVSGGGVLAANGTVSFSETGWNGEFALKGDRTELINQSELGIVASPDLLLKVSAEGGSLAGKVVIDQGRIEPEEMSGSDSESEDAVLMDELQEKTAWPFTMDIEVSLGDEVRIDGYGLKGDLKGGLKLTMMEQGPLTGKGEVYLSDSSFALFGRRLDITRGRIIFDGGPVDSPGLDVSATKTIKGQSLLDDDVIVGINVNGVIYDYNVDLFSIPPMEDSVILTQILLEKSSASDEGESGIIGAAAASIGLAGEDGVLGKMGELLPVDEMRITGSGLSDDSSLVLGKKLTENLSIRYDYSLYKNIGYFKIRYNFGHGVAAETKSSAEVNGVDLLYSFER